MIAWSRYPSLDLREGERPRSELRSDDGRFRIDGPVNRPGFRGYMLYVDGVHQETHHRQMDAKSAAEARL